MSVRRRKAPRKFVSTHKVRVRVSGGKGFTMRVPDVRVRALSKPVTDIATARWARG